MSASTTSSPRQYVQVLSEPAGGKWAWIAACSAMSIRLSDPGARVVLLIDTRSHQLLDDDARRAVETAYTEIVALDTPHEPGAVVSRHLKTVMRRVVRGDMLYLDIDTMLWRPPLEMFAGNHDLAGVKDRNYQCMHPHYPEWVKPYYEQFGWSFSEHGYFNGGVLFMRDSERARAFGELWHERWNRFRSVTGKLLYQPSLNSSIGMDGLDVRAFPISYNAMVDVNPRWCRGAFVIHYYFGHSCRLARDYALLAVLADDWQRTGAFDHGRMARALRGKTAWVHPTPSIQAELAAGRYVTAALLLGRRLLKRVLRCARRGAPADEVAKATSPR